VSSSWFPVHLPTDNDFTTTMHIYVPGGHQPNCANHAATVPAWIVVAVSAESNDSGHPFNRYAANEHNGMLPGASGRDWTVKPVIRTERHGAVGKTLPQADSVLIDFSKRIDNLRLRTEGSLL
jgi:hypothetical protein